MTTRKYWLEISEDDWFTEANEPVVCVTLHWEWPHEGSLVWAETIKGMIDWCEEQYQDTQQGWSFEPSNMFLFPSRNQAMMFKLAWA